jgi:hypothetical protein
VGEFEAVWEAAGYRIASSLDGVSSALVIGEDPIATACVALGIGRAQAQRRRVAVGDLIGDVPPLVALIDNEDPHGISDSFLYGVSLNRIARQVDPAGNLYVLPSGSEAVVQDEVLRNKRWRRLAHGFTEVGALLLLAAPADVPGLDELLGKLEGVVLVGDAESPIADAPVLATVRTAARRSTLDRMRIIEPTEEVVGPSAMRRWGIPVFLGAALVAAGAWAVRDRITMLGRSAPVAQAEQVTRTDSVAEPVEAPAVIDSTPALVAANPGDSASASSFAVELLAANTEDGATLKLREGRSAFPAPTITPVLLGEERTLWFKAMTGAYVNRSRADTLLAWLRSKQLVGTDAGAVVRAPFALLLDSAVARASVPGVVASYVARGIPAYALVQRDGRARVYAGAFQSPEQSSVLASTLRSANIEATLVYRVGRAF